jgi:DNA polymerase III delta subunit
MKHHFSIPDIGKVLQQPPFILNKFIAQVRNFSDFKIQEALKLIYELDYESKTCGEDSARISLQNFIFQVKFLKK